MFKDIPISEFLHKRFTKYETSPQLHVTINLYLFFFFLFRYH